jgi:hypothetical protein
MGVRLWLQLIFVGGNMSIDSILVDLTAENAKAVSEAIGWVIDSPELDDVQAGLFLNIKVQIDVQLNQLGQSK